MLIIIALLSLIVISILYKMRKQRVTMRETSGPASVFLANVVGLSLVIGTGPVVYIYISQFFLPSPESVSRMLVTPVSGLGDWLSASFVWYSLALAFVLIFAAFNAVSYRFVFAVSFSLNFVIQVAVGAVYQAISDGLSLDILWILLVLSLFGSVFVAGFVVILKHLGEMAVGQRHLSFRVRRSIEVMAPVVSGFVFNVFVYIAVWLLFYVQPVYIEGSLKGEFYITYVLQDGFDEKADDSSFGPTSNSLIFSKKEFESDRVRWLSPKSVHSLEWRKDVPESTWDLQVYFPVECHQDLDQLEISEGDRPYWVFPDVQNFSAQYLSGGSDLTLGVVSEDDDKFGLDTKENIRMLRFDESEDGRTKASLFITGGALRYWTASSDMSAFMSSIMVDYDSSGMVPAVRDLVIEVDGEERRISFNPVPFSRADSKLDCRMAGLDDLGEGNFEVDTEVAMSGVLFQLVRKDEFSFLKISEDNTLNVYGGGGWLVIPDYDSVSVPRNVAHIEFAQIGALDSQEVRIEGETHELESGAAMELRGARSSFRPLSADEIKYNGTVDIVYMEGVRLNETWWERMGGETKIFVAGILLNMIGAFLWFVHKLLKNHGVPSGGNG
ncbi:hypothetical protein LV475_00820 [Guyparkeria hydrothermalis]|uniref:hypothetical protein n=1 Tax=Guyparkeria TaxID=2035712 RepID=UPI0010AC9DC1|nr:MULTISPECIES: hypothetical protein [Guyparkeria]MCL7750152.1 hypothetical protein [Guyparkeria hydrothermalis]TKA89252.1 hypothetical protein FAZ79_06580 [Guyparkeria sp. SB14A]